MITEITEEHIDEWFMHHPASGSDEVAYRQLRAAGKRLAKAILMFTPTCPDQIAAIRKVREAVMTANSAIACRELYERVTATAPPP